MEKPLHSSPIEFDSTESFARTEADQKIETQPRWKLWRAGMTLLALIVITLSAHWNLGLGTFSAFGWGPLRIACPLGVAQVIAATQTFIPYLAIAALATVVLTMIFGRVFCGWFCPGRWIFNRGPRASKQPWGARGWIQTGILAGVIGVAYIFHNPLFCIICPVGSICRGALAVGTGESILPSIGWLSALVGTEWLSGRSWCRDLCPVGALYSRISALNPFIKPKANPAKCHPCNACVNNCPETLALAKSPDLSTCTKCFACVSACPRDAVEIRADKVIDFIGNK
ncbi:MAG: 4Fe-4S binding protein [Chloroflexi bacterium]|nr:4Fe-4S binding protein [Chloroflexota bacterium]